MNKTRLALGALALSVLVLGGVAVARMQPQDTTAESEPSVTSTPLNIQAVSTENLILQEEYVSYAAHQQVLDEGYLATVSANDFTAETPYIIVNPYEIAPQSALILFETEEAVTVTTSILGKTPETTITNTTTQPTTYHELPLIGLYEGENTVEVTLSNGECYTHTVTTQDIPEGYLSADTIDVLASDPSQLSAGLYVLKNTGRTLIDVNGDVRGYFTISLATSGADEVTDNGHLFVTMDEYTTYSVIMELDYMGQVYREIQTSNLNTHHDAYLIDDSTLLLGTSYIDLDSYEVHYYDPALEEIFNYESGSVEVRSYGDMDALHLNTIDDGGEGYILVSFRNQHAVAKLSYPELEVQWVFSVYDQTYMGTEDVYLTPIGDDFEWFYSQHDVCLVGENGDGTIDITLFDNGVQRGLDLEAEYPDDQLYSRMVRYRVDEVNMTVEQIWDYGQELGNEYLAFVHSSTQYIPESNTYLGTFDSQSTIESGGAEVPRSACYIIELTEDKETVFHLAFDAPCYRTEKLTADVFYSAWEGIGAAQKDFVYLSGDLVSYDNSLVLESEAASYQITVASATQDGLDLAGWVTIGSAMDSAVESRQLVLTSVDTGDSYLYTMGASPWQLQNEAISQADRDVLNRSAGFSQKRMNISTLAEGDYALTLIVTIDGLNYAVQLEEALRIGEG